MRPGFPGDFKNRTDTRNVRRRLLITLTAAGTVALAAPLALADTATSPSTSTSTSTTSSTTLSPVWADPILDGRSKTTAATATPPLSSLGQVEQVIGAQSAWSAGYTGQGADVAVIDTGIAPVPGLDAPGKLVYGPDLSFDSQDPSTAYLDGYGHGTSMAGLIAAADIGDGVQGVAPGARLVSVRVGARSGAVDVSQIIAAIDWVVQHRNRDGLNIRVINLSLGTDSAQDYQLDPLAHAAEVAWRHGIVVVAAVGNDGTTNRNVADPAADPYVLAVGAEDPNGTLDSRDDTIPSFSSRGGHRHADVVAPGVSIVGLRAPGSTLDNLFPSARVGDRFFRGSGTSQATALVSGAAAVLLSQRPDLSPDRVKSLLMSTARSLPKTTSTYAGDGLVSLSDAISTKAPRGVQTYPVSTGAGSLESARGSMHVTDGQNPLTGEQDIFGNPYDAAAQGQLEESDSAWTGGAWNGSTWTGSNWSTVTWSGSNWSGNTWTGNTWTGNTWTGNTWTGNTWSGVNWSGVNWSGSNWATGDWS